MATRRPIEPGKNLAAPIQTIQILREKSVFRHQSLVAGVKGWKSLETYGSLRLGGPSCSRNREEQ